MSGRGRQATTGLFALASCVEPRTEVVARVDSELSWGEGQRVQSVAVEVRRGGPTGALRSQRVSALGLRCARPPY